MIRGVVALNSGGLDSNVLMAYLNNNGYKIHSLFVNYGQNQFLEEMTMAKAICDKYRCVSYQASISMPWIEKTSMVNGVVRDWGAEGELNCIEHNTYIPMRNMVLLSIAYSLAESLGIPNIAFAFDGSQNIFGKPTGGTTDKHPKFVKAINKAANEGSAMKHVLGCKFTTITPLMGLNKVDIIKRGILNDADMSLSWSCYNSDAIPCMKCSACRLRAQSFYIAGYRDPLMEKLDIEELPFNELFGIDDLY